MVVYFSHRSLGFVLDRDNSTNDYEAQSSLTECHDGKGWVQFSIAHRGCSSKCHRTTAPLRWSPRSRPPPHAITQTIHPNGVLPHQGAPPRFSLAIG